MRDWTDEQKAAHQKLEDEGRIVNKRPCGCFDVVVGDVGEHFTLVVLIACANCAPNIHNFIQRAEKAGLN